MAQTTEQINQLTRKLEKYQKILEADPRQAKDRKLMDAFEEALDQRDRLRHGLARKER